MKFKRRVTRCYVLEDDAPFESSPIKICRSRRLAEHYKRILEPKWEEAFGFGLRIIEEKFYEDDEAETPVENIIQLHELEEEVKRLRHELLCRDLEKLPKPPLENCRCYVPDFSEETKDDE